MPCRLSISNHNHADMSRRITIDCCRKEEEPYAALEAEVRRCRTSLMRAFKREFEGLARMLARSFETLPTRRDLERLEEAVRDLRRLE
jgi:hypothetical protein